MRTRIKPLLAPFALALMLALAPRPAPAPAQATGAPAEAPAAEMPVLDAVRDYGAKGDGKSDDTGAFAALARELNKRGGGVRIAIPPGTYLVGGQVQNGRNADGNTYRYDGLDVMIFQNCSRPIVIEGTGARLRLPDGLRLGSFNPDGSVLNPALPFYSSASAAITGYMVGAVKCANVTIRGLELDGNSTGYVLGGAWGDKDIQCRSYGLYFDRCAQVLVEKVSAHHFGLDGVYIKHGGLKEGDPPTPHTLRLSRFEYNARQGLSWSGGIGLRAESCVFAHTGYAVNRGSGKPLANAPSAGVDIEAEESICRDGEFIGCEFLHTKGPAMYMETGDNAGVAFRRCRFWNFENYSIVPHDPRVEFHQCAIHGAATSAYTSRERPQDGTKFVRCDFEDREHPDFGAPFSDAYASLLSFDDLSGGLLFEECRFVANRVKGPFVRNPRDNTPPGFEVRGGSMLLRHFNGAGEAVATLQGGVVRNFHIGEEFEGEVPPALHVWTNNQTKAGPELWVHGPRIRWRAGHGEAGLIAPTEQH